MDQDKNAVLETLLRAQGFLDENAALLASVDFTTARRQLDQIVTSFTTHAVTQGVGDWAARRETAKQRQLGSKLRHELMKPIAVIAGRTLRDTPAFGALQMPKANARGENFLWQARTMLDAATIHRDRFVAQGLPATFLAEFRAALEELSTSLSERQNNRGRRAAATGLLRFHAQQGRTVLCVLDALVRRAAGDNESLLRSWQAVRHIDRRTASTTAAAA